MNPNFENRVFTYVITGISKSVNLSFYFMRFSEYCFENDDFIDDVLGINIETFAFCVVHYKG
jgi:hypothetical protein